MGLSFGTDIRDSLDRVLGLRPGERGAALVLMFTGALLIAGLTIAKSIRDSLFLVAFPAERLPLVLVTIAVLTAPVVSSYSHLSNRVPFRVLAPGFYMIVAIGFMLMERLYASSPETAAIALYLYVSLLGLLGVTQFWLLVAWRFNTREARRLIGFIGTGSVVGGLVGGLLARSLSRYIHPEAILWIVAGTYASAGLATDWITRQHQEGAASAPPARQDGQTGMRSGLRQISREPLLRYVVVLVLLSVFLGTLTDYQLKSVAQGTYTSKVELVRFFGGFYAIIGLASLVLQIGITQYVMRRWGVAGSLLTLPLALLPGCAAMLFAPGIVAATVLRGGDQGIRNSSFRSGYEILFLPLSPELRRQTKPVVDVFVERTSDGLAGLFLIVLTSFLDFHALGLTWVTLGLCIALGGLVLRLRRAYVSTLEKNLSVAVLNDVLETPVAEATVLQTVEMPTFAAQDPRLLQSLEVSSRLSSMKGMPIELLKHPSAPIRERAMSMLEALGAGKPLAEAEIEQLRSDAAAASNEEVRTSASRAIAELQSRPAAPAAAELGSAEIFSRLVSGRGAEVQEALVQLQRLGDVRLAAAALPLIEDRRSRERVEAVMHRFGPDVAGLLSDVLLNEAGGVRLRRHAARLLGELDSPLAEFALKKALMTRPGEVRRAVSTALYIMRSRGASKGLSVEELQELLEPEVRRNLSIWEADTELRRSPELAASGSHEALLLSVRETKSRTLRHLFRLLGLCFPPEAIQAAYKGLTAGNPQVRDQALEYLDNVLPERLRALVWPLMDPEARWSEKPSRHRDVEHIMMDLMRSGVTIDLPREAIDLSLEPASEE
jgi:HEAT repeat protein